jgi:hypothetical protein
MSQTLPAPGPLVFEGHANTPAIHLPDGTVQQPFLTPVQQPAAFRNGHVNLDTFSPVNENGSFEFDRVLKSQKVNRRVKPKHVRLLACGKFALHLRSILMKLILGVQSLLEACISRSTPESSISLQG